jgi:hypothetical protein
MKSNLPPRLGMIDAIAAGLNQAARRPWLWVFPALVDLILWLGPRFSIEQFGQRLVQTWKALLPMAYTGAQITAMQDVIAFAEEGMAIIGKQVNLLGLLAFGWLASPSAFAQWQPTRFTLLSDGVLAPLGLGLNLPRTARPQLSPTSIEVNSVWLILLVVVVAWLAGQIIMAVFYRSAALGLQPVSPTIVKLQGRLPRANEGTRTAAAGRPELVNPPGLAHLTLRMAAVSLIAGVSALFLTLPLALVGLFAQLIGGGGAELLLALSGGVTLWLMLWFLSALFFVGDLLVLDGAPLWTSLFQSLVFARASGFRTLAFAALINVIVLGARALWGIIAVSPLGTLLAILLNSILVSGMLLSIFVYYRSLRHYWLAVRATSEPTH